MSPAGVAALNLLERAGIGTDRFAALVGVKPGSVRSAFSSGRISAAMKEVLHRLANDEQIREMTPLAPESPAPDALRAGRVYLIPVNKRLRMVEFPDGSHGKFLSKPDRFPVGSEVRLRLVDGDVWEPVGDYDRRGRLVE